MISAHIKQYCKNYTEIENYEEAVADTTQIWECHHKLENLGLSKKQLKKMGMYYNVIPRELIFLTHAEHQKLHHKGKKLSEEHKKHISEAKKGNSNRPKRYIRCIETGKVHYKTEWVRLGYTHIHEVASGSRKSCRGLHFEYVD